MDMTKSEFLIYSIKNKLVHEIIWWKSMYTIPGHNDYLRLEDGNLYYKDINLGPKPETSYFTIYDKVTIPPGVLRNAPDGVTGPIGRILVNYLVFDYGTDMKINAYIDKEFSHKAFMNDVKNYMIKTKDVSIYKNLAKVAMLLRNLARYIVIPKTESTFFAPEGLKEFKEETIQRYVKEYGEDWYTDKLTYIKYEADMMKWVDEYLKDDPTYKITLARKGLKSFKMRFISAGVTENIDPTKAGTIVTALSDEFNLERGELSKVFNSVIYGSSMRGLSTIDAGVIVKRLLAAAHAFVIDVEDCKTKDGYDIKISEGNIEQLVPLYFIVGGKNSVKFTIEDLKSMIGKTIPVRVPAYCKAQGLSLCSKCAGDNISINTNGVGLLISGITGDNVNLQLSKFHGSAYKVFKISKKYLLGL